MGDEVYYILDKKTDRETGFKYICIDGNSFWGINSKGEYSGFSKKYYYLKSERDVMSDLALTAYY